ncbi:MAG: SMI1/KNR4 family protein [Oscillibacter sp.]|nr:SMI1/KNR4 family protein [Oscillibacter sp.]
MKIQYNLLPGELLEHFEPVYGKMVEGFSETELADAEERLGIRIPASYRSFLLQYGKCSLNSIQNYLIAPDSLQLAYDCYRETRDEDYDPDDPEWAVDKWWSEGQGWVETVNPLAELFQHPEDEWNRFVKDHLIIWHENQGCWIAGIRTEDFEKETIPVYIPDELYSYTWEMEFPSLEEFLTRMIFAAIEYKNPQIITGNTDIQDFFDTNQIDRELLCPPEKSSPSGHCRSFYLPEKHLAGFFLYDVRGENDTLSIYQLP